MTRLPAYILLLSLFLLAACNEEKKEFTPVFAPVGDGNIDFTHLTPILLECGAEHFLVEQDNAAAMPDPLGQVARSIRYIKNQL